MGMTKAEAPARTTDEGTPLVRSTHSCARCGGALDVVLGGIPFWVHADPDDLMTCWA